MTEFTDKVVIVTGACSGIGRATAVYFAAQGAKLAITGLNDVQLRDTKLQCQENGTKEEEILEVAGDLTDEEFAKKFVSMTVNTFGQLDVLINNHGVATDSSLKCSIDDPLELYDKIVDVNVRSTIRLVQLCVSHLEMTKGCIVITSSIASGNQYDHMAYYGSTKAQLDSFVRSLSVLLGPKGIRVNTINPGTINTPILTSLGMLKALYDKWTLGQTDRWCPLKRRGEPEEMASVIGFLASNKNASFVNGHHLIADGGFTNVLPE